MSYICYNKKEAMKQPGKKKDMKNRFEYVEVPVISNVKRQGITIEGINEFGYGKYHINGLPVIEIIRRGNNTNTAGGASSVGYQIDGKPETRQKSIKKLVESFK